MQDKTITAIWVGLIVLSLWKPIRIGYILILVHIIIQDWQLHGNMLFEVGLQYSNHFLAYRIWMRVNILVTIKDLSQVQFISSIKFQTLIISVLELFTFSTLQKFLSRRACEWQFSLWPIHLSIRLLIWYWTKRNTVCNKNSQVTGPCCISSIQREMESEVMCI